MKKILFVFTMLIMIGTGQLCAQEVQPRANYYCLGSLGEFDVYDSDLDMGGRYEIQASGFTGVITTSTTPIGPGRPRIDAVSGNTLTISFNSIGLLSDLEGYTVPIEVKIPVDGIYNPYGDYYYYSLYLIPHHDL